MPLVLFTGAWPQLRHEHPGGFLSLHSSFVDDTGNAGYRDDMASVVTQSVLSAYVIFGFPGSDRWGNRPEVITAAKWQDHVSQHLRYLGFDIDAACMLVRWPYAKRLRLASVLDLVYQDAKPLRKGKSVQLRLIVQVLGLTRNGGLVSPLALLSVLQLQYCVNDAVCERFSNLPATINFCHNKHLLQRWWRWIRIAIPASVWVDIQWLFQILDLSQPLSLHWARSIGLLIRRTPDFEMYSDASYEALGGWCRYLGLVWRVTTVDLSALGFPVDSEEFARDNAMIDKLHINPLEFLAIIIEVWICLAFLWRADPHSRRDWIVLIRADNTSALSWIRSAGRCRRPVVRRLARFLQALLTFNPVRLSLQDLHIPGKENDGADALS